MIDALVEKRNRLTFQHRWQAATRKKMAQFFREKSLGPISSAPHSHISAAKNREGEGGSSPKCLGDFRSQSKPGCASSPPPHLCLLKGSKQEAEVTESAGKIIYVLRAADGCRQGGGGAGRVRKGKMKLSEKSCIPPINSSP